MDAQIFEGGVGKDFYMKYLNSSFLLILLTSAHALSAADPATWNLWPGEPPLKHTITEPEYDRTASDGRLVAGRRVIRLTNVTTPTLAIYKPAASLDTAAAIIIAPGGAHNILAYDLEGTEVATWFNSIGVTAIVLKYTVPGRAFDKARVWLSAAQDGQRAVSLVRSRAKEIGVDPDRIGIMGFSAGCTPLLHSSLGAERLYTATDKHDKVSFRPSFAAPIYIGYNADRMTIPKDCPPFFMVVTHDDKDRGVSVAKLYIMLKEAGVSAEMHVYESGGHGYGLRPTNQPVTTWPARMEDWMRYKGLLKN